MGGVVCRVLRPDLFVYVLHFAKGGDAPPKSNFSSNLLRFCAARGLWTTTEVLGTPIDDLAGSKRLKYATVGALNLGSSDLAALPRKVPLRERKELFSVIDAYLERHRLAQIAKAS